MISTPEDHAAAIHDWNPRRLEFLPPVRRHLGTSESQLELFTKKSLWLGIIAAVIGTVGQVVAPDPKSVVSKVAGIAGSIIVALAGVAATQATAGGRDKLWVKSWAAGEAIKSAVCLYCAGVPPFNAADRASVLADKVEKARTDLQGLELRPGTPTDPPGQLSVTDYITSACR